MWTRRRFVTTASLAGAAASVPLDTLARGERVSTAPAARERYTLYMSDPVRRSDNRRTALVAVEMSGQEVGRSQRVELESMLMPSVVIRHPGLPVLYVAGDEDRGGSGRASGVVAAYAIAEKTRELRALGTQSLALSALTGTGLAISPDGRSLLASAMGGTYTVLPLHEDGTLGSIVHVLKMTGGQWRRGYPHLHSVLWHPAGVGYGTDLSSHRLNAISFIEGVMTATQHTLPVDDGGPTAMALSAVGDALFVVARHASCVVVFPVDPDTGLIAGEPQAHTLPGTHASTVAAGGADGRVYLASQEGKGAMWEHGGSPTLLSVYSHGRRGAEMTLIEEVRVPEIRDARRLLLHGSELLLIGLGGVAVLQIEESGSLGHARHMVHHGLFNDAVVYAL